MIDQARLKERLKFDANTASFIWLHCADAGEKFNQQWEGRKAGSKDRKGQLIITVDGKKYRATDLLWLYSTGQWADTHHSVSTGPRPRSEIVLEDLDGRNI